jgi:hypothetical protein
VVAVAGCDGVLGLTDITPRVADAPTVCVANANVISETFQQAGNCPAWSSSFGSATVLSGGGMLRILNNPAAKSMGGCTGNGTFALDERGVFIEVDKVLTEPNAYTVFSLGYGTNLAVGLAVESGGLLKMVNFDSTFTYGMIQETYLPAQMKFWRLRADLVADAVVGEYSPDAITWFALTSTQGMLKAPKQVFIAIGAGDDTEGSGTAIFSHLNVCP